MKNHNKSFLLYLLIAFSNLYAQEPVEIPIEEERDNKIKALSEIVKMNKDIYVSEDQARLTKFINLVEEREKLLQSSKIQLKNENAKHPKTFVPIVPLQALQVVGVQPLQKGPFFATRLTFATGLTFATSPTLAINPNI